MALSGRFPDLATLGRGYRAGGTGCLPFCLLVQIIPHILNEDLVRRRELSRANRFFQTMDDPVIDRLRRVIVSTFQLGYRQRQVATQIAAGKQFIIAGVVYHFVD